MDWQGKIGPLPAWTWGVLIGGAFAVWFWASRSNGSVTVEESSDEDYEMERVPVSGDFSTVPVLTPTPTETDTAGDTNADWLVKAVNSVVTNSSHTPVAAQGALMKYLSGDSALTVTEAAIVNLAIRFSGLPPEGVHTAPTVQNPATPDKTPDWDKRTKVVLSVPGKLSFGSTLVLKATVSWLEKNGRTMSPSGKIRFTVDGTDYTVTAFNGVGMKTIPVRRTDSRFKDRAAIVRASFLPSSTKADRSSSSPVTVRIS
jgi:hypothetical protein